MMDLYSLLFKERGRISYLERNTPTYQYHAEIKVIYP